MDFESPKKKQFSEDETVNHNKEYKSEIELEELSPMVDRVSVQENYPQKESDQNQPNPKCFRYLGIILAILSSITGSLAVMLMKILAPDYHPNTATFIMFQGILWPHVPVLIYKTRQTERVFDVVWPLNAPGNPKTILLLLIRGTTGATSLILHAYSLQYISAADSSVIAYSTPVFVSVASHFLLGEKSGFVPITCGIVAMIGVAVITRPPILTGSKDFDYDVLLGTGLAFGCMLLAASTLVLLRYLRDFHFSLMNVYYGLHGSIEVLLLSAFISSSLQLPRGLNDWLTSLSLAFLTFLLHAFITLAFRYETAGTISLCRTMDIVFAFLWQFIFLGVLPDTLGVAGGLIVIFALVVAGVRKVVTELPEESLNRKRLWFLLK